MLANQIVENAKQEKDFVAVVAFPCSVQLKSELTKICASEKISMELLCRNLIASFIAEYDNSCVDILVFPRC